MKIVRSKPGGKGSADACIIRKWSRRTLILLVMLGVGIVGLMAAGEVSAQSGTRKGATPGASLAPGTPDCGPNWVQVDDAFSIASRSGLEDVAVLSTNDAWVVGWYESTNRYRTLIEHWDGSAWHLVPSPNFGNISDNYLKAVAAIGPNNVWAVGYADDIELPQHEQVKTLIVHWDGSAWNIVPSPNPGDLINYLDGMTALSANNIWAVGKYELGIGVQLSLVEHWDGASWNTVPAASPNANSYLNEVSAVSANDIWAVGNYRDGSMDRTLVEHWDGSQWAQVPSPSPYSDWQNLMGVAAISTNNVWAAGTGGNASPAPGQTLVEHWNGNAWNRISSPNPSSTSGLNGISAVAHDDMWAVGYKNENSPEQTLIEHWDGNEWSSVSSPNPGDAMNQLNAVAALSTNEAWAVGMLKNNGSASKPLIERYHLCTTATPTANPTSTRTPRPTQTPGPQPTACPIQFSDVPQGSVFYSSVRCLACRGIISGYADGTFLPNAHVTRGQLAKIVANAAGYSDPQPNQMFEDVPVGSTFQVYIGNLASRGIMGGYPCGGPGEPCGSGNLPYFRPSINASRGQISKIVANAANFTDPPGAQIFEDVAPGSTFYDYIQRLGSRDIANGFECGGAGEPCVAPGNRRYFRPGNFASRARLRR